MDQSVSLIVLKVKTMSNLNKKFYLNLWKLFNNEKCLYLFLNKIGQYISINMFSIKLIIIEQGAFYQFNGTTLTLTAIWSWMNILIIHNIDLLMSTIHWKIFLITFVIYCLFTFTIFYHLLNLLKYECIMIRNSKLGCGGYFK